nr:TadE family protein [Methylobacterium sp.]
MAVQIRSTCVLRLVRSLVSNRSGASAVEFALVAPILIAMIASIFTISMVMHAHSSISTYAREAARGVAVGYMTVAEAKQFAETRARDDLRVVVSVNIVPATRGDQSRQDVIVTLSISTEEIAKITPFGNIILGGLSARAVMRSLIE